MSETTMADATINVDTEFQSLITPPTKDEREGLEASIKVDGCRDALVVWSQGDLLLDGHNRHGICEAHGIGYRVKRIDLEDRKAAINWIINNQLSRRNLTPEQQQYLWGKRYHREKDDHGGDRKSRYQNDTLNGGHSGRLRDRLGEEYKVSPQTITRSARFSDAVDKLTEVHGPEIRERILTRDSHIPKKTVIAASKLETPEAQLEALAENREPASAPAKLPAEKRAEQIRELAALGHLSTQIADKIGIGREQVKTIAKRFDIPLADAMVGAVHTAKPERIIGETIATLEGLAMGLGLIDAAAIVAIDPEQRKAWQAAMSKSMKPIRRLLKQLTEASSNDEEA